MKARLLTSPLRSAALIASLFLAAGPSTVHAQTYGRIDYDVLKREQRGLGNVLTDGETDLSSGETRMRNNSLHLSAEDVARAASKVAHLRAMAQLHPERCARTTGAFLYPTWAAEQALTNNFFGNLKPRIVHLEDNLDSYVARLERLDPKLGAELRNLIAAYNKAAFEVVSGKAGNIGSIDYNPTSIDSRVAPDLRENSIFNNVNRSGGGAGGYDSNDPNSPNYRGRSSSSGAVGGGLAYANPGYNGAYSGGGNGTYFPNGGNGPFNLANFNGTIRDAHGNILNKDDFLNPTTRVMRMKSENGILTREEKFMGEFALDGKGGAQWKEGEPKIIDWQFDIDTPRDGSPGFDLVDRSSGQVDDDKNFTVEKWSVKEPAGDVKEFPGGPHLNYTMGSPGQYTITATVMTKLQTHFIISISPVNN